MTSADRISETFEGTQNATMKVALNFPHLRYFDHDAYVDANHTYISVSETGNSIYFAISKGETRALRDHLNRLLVEEEGLLDVSEPVVSAAAVGVMRDLTDALNNFNK